jgi:hypothetical protein
MSKRVADSPPQLQSAAAEELQKDTRKEKRKWKAEEGTKNQTQGMASPESLLCGQIS